ncbi:MAG: amidohydrolase [Candidatus Heimdallarchaeota archaeon]
MPKEEALNWIVQNEARIIELSDTIWKYAEVGLQEFKSSALLAQELETAGFMVHHEISGMPTAFVASYGSGMPVLGIMGEFDALPGLSQKAMPYKDPVEEGAPGHGCGHNIHGTSGMAAAIAVRVVMEEKGIPGTLKFFGCPAEESFDAKVLMVRDGVFRNVEAVLSHHPSLFNVPPLRSSNAMNSVKFHFYGTAAHAAGSPTEGRGATDAVELMNVGVNYLREHIVQEARIHYVIEDGGHEPNVIPAYARSWYYVRAPERDQVEHIYKWVLNIAKGADLMAGTTHKIEFLGGCYNTLPNKRLGTLVTKNMRKIGAPTYTEEEFAWAAELNKSITPEQKREFLRRSKRPGWEKLMDILLDQSIPDPWDEGIKGGGSTDVADVSWNTPTMEFNTVTGILGTPGHSWQFVAQCGMSIGHKSLLFATKTLAASIIDLFTQPEILTQVHEEFAERTKGIEYRSPIPSDLKPPLKGLIT